MTEEVMNSCTAKVPERALQGPSAHRLPRSPGSETEGKIAEESGIITRDNKARGGISRGSKLAILDQEFE